MSQAEELNPRQEKFARLYYAGPEELRDNGRRRYMEAYNLGQPRKRRRGCITAVKPR